MKIIRQSILIFNITFSPPPLVIFPSLYYNGTDKNETDSLNINIGGIYETYYKSIRFVSGRTK